MIYVYDFRVFAAELAGMGALVYFVFRLLDRIEKRRFSATRTAVAGNAPCSLHSEAATIK